MNGVRMLVVDDNRTNRLILEEVLSHWGALPVSVEDGEAALAALEAAAVQGTPFAVVVLDQMMPGMDGFQLADRLRSDPRLGRPEMLMLTSGDPVAESGQTYQDFGISSLPDETIQAIRLVQCLD